MFRKYFVDILIKKRKKKETAQSKSEGNMKYEMRIMLLEKEKTDEVERNLNLFKGCGSMFWKS